jgi:hypothetical protein
VLVLFDVSRAWSGVRDMTMLTELTGGNNDVGAGQRKNGDQAVEHRRENHMRRMLFYNFYKTTKTWRDVDISNEYQAESHVNVETSLHPTFTLQRGTFALIEMKTRRCLGASQEQEKSSLQS